VGCLDATDLAGLGEDVDAAIVGEVREAVPCERPQRVVIVE
jgi:hypothetical protein